MKPYYSDDHVTLYHGDCREITAWLEADVLVTDPPYGIGWKRHGGGRPANGRGADRHEGIANDADTGMRDQVLNLWGDRPAVSFGSFYAPQPENLTHVAVFRASANAGVLGSTTGFRRDVFPVFITGPWPPRSARSSSLIQTTTNAGSPNSPQAKHSHPHAKPLDAMVALIEACPPGVIADPFAGSGSTLVAAKLLGRKAIGVEIEERYCEIAAARLAQEVLMFEDGAA